MCASLPPPDMLRERTNRNISPRTDIRENVDAPDYIKVSVRDSKYEGSCFCTVLTGLLMAYGS